MAKDSIKCNAISLSFWNRFLFYSKEKRRAH